MADITIIDMDGCISDDRWRKHFIDRANKQWDDYHRLALLDSPINLDIALPYMRGNYAICTGRPELWRDRLVTWLKRNSLPVSPHILMRPDNDFRSAVELKREMLAKLRVFGHSVTHAFDDQLAICEMYVAEGVQHVHRLTTKRKHREICS